MNYKHTPRRKDIIIFFTCDRRHLLWYVVINRFHLHQLRDIRSCACKAGACSYHGRDVVDLKAHLTGTHGLFLCNLCVEHRNVFVSELELYNRTELSIHMGSLFNSVMSYNSRDFVFCL